MLNVKWLQALRAVVQAGTVTEAAGRLCITQPAVSRMLANLEAELGFALFSRHRGRLSITPQGEAFYFEVEAALAGLDGIGRAGKNIRSGSGIHLRLFAFSPLCNELVPMALAKFVEEYPTATTSVELRMRRDVTQWVAGGQFDLGLVFLPVAHLAARTRAFAQIPAYVVIPDGHRLAERDEISLVDLAQEQLIMLPTTSLLRRLIDGKFAEIGHVPTVRVETSTLLSACQLAANGLGVTVADPFTVRALVGRRFVARPLVPQLMITFGFILPPERTPSPMVARFMEIVASTAQELLFSPIRE